MQTTQDLREVNSRERKRILKNKPISNRGKGIDKSVLGQNERRNISKKLLRPNRNDLFEGLNLDVTSMEDTLLSTALNGKHLGKARRDR